MRDYDAEMKEIFDRALDVDGDLVPTVVAHEIIARLSVEDPDLLIGWNQSRLTIAVATEVRGLLSRRRSRARSTASVFDRRRREYDSRVPGDDTDGDETRRKTFVGSFDARYRVDDKNTQRRVADMTAEDCEFVAQSYRAAEAAMNRLATFQEAVARRLRREGAETVGDIFTEETYHRLLTSLS